MATEEESKRCESCKWWKTALDWEGDGYTEEHRPPVIGQSYGYGFGGSGEPAPGRWGWCTLVAEFGPQSGSDRFFVIDGSEYMAHLHTRNDFGCVMHEPPLVGEG